MSIWYRCKDRDDLKYSGVYFCLALLMRPKEKFVYFGQSDARKNGQGILARLLEHKRNSEKDYWIEAVMFKAPNNSLGETEIEE